MPIIWFVLVFLWKVLFFPFPGFYFSSSSIFRKNLVHPYSTFIFKTRFGPRSFGGGSNSCRRAHGVK